MSLEEKMERVEAPGKAILILKTIGVVIMPAAVALSAYTAETWAHHPETRYQFPPQIKAISTATTESLLERYCQRYCK